MGSSFRGGAGESFPVPISCGSFATPRQSTFCTLTWNSLISLGPNPPDFFKISVKQRKVLLLHSPRNGFTQKRNRCARANVTSAPELFPEFDSHAHILVKVKNTANGRSIFPKECCWGSGGGLRSCRPRKALKTSIISSTRIPMRSIRRAPSQVLIKMVCRTILWTSFIVWPAPLSPKWKVFSTNGVRCFLVLRRAFFPPPIMRTSFLEAPRPIPASR